MSKKEITMRDQRTAAEILTMFMMTKDMDEIIKVWNKVFKDYNLCLDPFTNTPVAPVDYLKEKIEYEKQLMIEKYGHCDGLE